MGSMANSLTNLAGIKLFKGGPYIDAGVGDQQMGAVQQYMQQLAPVIAQIAQQAGVANPQVPGSQGQFTNDPYGLTPLEQASVNQQASTDRLNADNIMARVQADLSAKGMWDSSAATAAQAYLSQQVSAQQGQERVQAGENAYQNRNQALQQIAQLLGQGYGAQSNVLQSQKQTAVEASTLGQQNFANMLALGLMAGGVLPVPGASKGTTPLPSTAVQSPSMSDIFPQDYTSGYAPVGVSPTAPGGWSPNGSSGIVQPTGFTGFSQFTMPSIYNLATGGAR